MDNNPTEQYISAKSSLLLHNLYRLTCEASKSKEKMFTAFLAKCPNTGMSRSIPERKLQKIACDSLLRALEASGAKAKIIEENLKPVHYNLDLKTDTITLGYSVLTENTLSFKQDFRTAGLNLDLLEGYVKQTNNLPSHSILSFYGTAQLDNNLDLSDNAWPPDANHEWGQSIINYTKKLSSHATSILGVAVDFYVMINKYDKGSIEAEFLPSGLKLRHQVYEMEFKVPMGTATFKP
jgi:hypothetical protein